MRRNQTQFHHCFGNGGKLTAHKIYESSFASQENLKGYTDSTTRATGVSHKKERK